MLTNDSQRGWTGSVAAVLPLAVLYLLALFPGVGGRLNPGDSAKFQYIGEILGIPHEPGYPQYVLLNWIWTRVRLFDELALQVNLLSVSCALVAAWLIFLLGSRLSGSVPAAVVGTWFGFLPARTWVLATEAEVYALHLVYVAAVLYLGCRWSETRATKPLAALLVVYSFGFGNHLSLIALLPAMVVLVTMTEPRVLTAPRWLAFGAASILAGAAQYLFLLVRAWQQAPYREALVSPDATLGDLLVAVQGQRHTAEHMFAGGWKGIVFDRPGELLAEAATQLTVPVLLVALAGLAVLLRVRRGPGWFVATAGAGVAAFSMAYEIPDWWVNALPLWAMSGALVPVGLVALAARGGRWRSVLIFGCGVTLALLVARGWDEVQPRERFDREAMIALSPRGAAIVTALEHNYLDDQVGNYYRFTSRVVTDKALSFETAAQVLADDLLFSDRPLVFASTLDSFVRRVRRDVVGVSLEPSLVEWLNSQPAGTETAILSTDMAEDRVRQALADALAPVGESRSLRERIGESCCYVAFGEVGGERLRERLRAGDAFLPATDERVRRSGEVRPGVPKLFAGTAAQGVLTAFGDTVLQTPGVHAYVRLPDSDRWVYRQFGPLPPIPAVPYQLLSGRGEPIERLRLQLDGDGPPEVRDEAGSPLGTRSQWIELVVVSRERGFSKGAVRYRPDGEGVSALSATIETLPSGDTFVLLLSASSAHAVANLSPGRADALAPWRAQMEAGAGALVGIAGDPLTWSWVSDAEVMLDLDTMRVVGS